MMAFDRLEAGRATYALALAVYRVTENYPKREWYGLAAQALPAAFSAPLNRAEGAAKRWRREFRRFADIAIGSLAEVAIILRFSRDLAFLTEKQFVEVMALKETASRLTFRLA